MTAATLPPNALPKIFGEPQLHTDGELLALIFGRDGSLWSVEEPGILRHWNSQTGQQLEWHSVSEFETLWAFSSDARVLASAADDLSFWDTSAGTILTALPQESWVTALAFHPDSSHAATGHDDGAIRYWDGAGHQMLHEFRMHKMPISALAISPDGAILAAAGEDKILSLWDLKSGQRIATFPGHTDRIPALAWHPGGRYLVSAGWDATARVWDAQTQEPVILLNTHTGQVTALAFNADGSLLATGDSELNVHVWDFAQRKTLHVLKGPQSEIRCLAFSPDSHRLASNGDGVLHLWDPRAGKALSDSGSRHVTRTSLSLHPDGVQLATNTGGGLGRVWNVSSKKDLFKLEEKETLHQLAYSKDGKWLAGAAGAHLRLWYASTGAIIRDMEGPEEPITAVAISADSRTLASASSLGMSVWLWSVHDGEPTLLIPDALDGCTIESLAFHPTRNLIAVGGIDHLATGGSDGAISLWDIANRCEIATFGGGATSIAIHPKGKLLASASLEQSICIWDLDNQALLLEFTGHDGQITSVVYSPDGRLLASASEDRTVRLWNEEGDEQASVELDTQVTALAFSPDGQFLYTANANTTCYQLKIADLLRAQN